MFQPDKSYFMKMKKSEIYADLCKINYNFSPMFLKMFQTDKSYFMKMKKSEIYAD